MGSNAASSGGSDTADERRQDSYSKQFRKNYKITKKGEVKEKSGLEKAIQDSPAMTVIGSVADTHNYNRRLRFAEKKGLNLLSKSKEYVLSPAGKAYLDEFGYQKTLEAPQDKTDGNVTNEATRLANDNAPPKQIAMSPTEAELSQSAATDADAKEEDILYRKRKTKRAGRSLTILTSSKGATDGLTLGKKSLLGS